MGIITEPHDSQRRATKQNRDRDSLPLFCRDCGTHIDSYTYTGYSLAALFDAIDAQNNGYCLRCHEAKHGWLAWLASWWDCEVRRKSKAKE